MEYFINPIWFYLISLSDSLKTIFLVVGICVTLGGALAYPVIGDEYDYDTKSCSGEWNRISKIIKKVIILGSIAISLGCILPSRQTCKEMLVASVVTKENMSTVKEETYEMIDYIVDKVNGKGEN
jgi:hypothetical protein